MESSPPDGSDPGGSSGESSSRSSSGASQSKLKRSPLSTVSVVFESEYKEDSRSTVINTSVSEGLNTLNSLMYVDTAGATSVSISISSVRDADTVGSSARSVNTDQPAMDSAVLSSPDVLQENIVGNWETVGESVWDSILDNESWGGKVEEAGDSTVNSRSLADKDTAHETLPTASYIPSILEDSPELRPQYYDGPFAANGPNRQEIYSLLVKFPPELRKMLRNDLDDCRLFPFTHTHENTRGLYDAGAGCQKCQFQHDYVKTVYTNYLYLIQREKAYALEYKHGPITRAEYENAGRYAREMTHNWPEAEAEATDSDGGKGTEA
ncbi:hypothetical protein BZA70DRAFT_123192 [Myxozyma melibiosi]|uniref:Uncharacterized protein n=1 Tax=Myxozyma melibiosi TaxID=54550 RepID=A0ABR1F8A7_9ASCO